jgi:hypothetical protein
MGIRVAFRTPENGMQLFTAILFWLGIIFLTDGSLGLLFEEKWKKLAGGLNIQRLAQIEIGIALSLLAGHYLLLGSMA